VRFEAKVDESLSSHVLQCSHWGPCMASLMGLGVNRAMPDLFVFCAFTTTWKTLSALLKYSIYTMKRHSMILQIRQLQQFALDYHNLLRPSSIVRKVFPKGRFSSRRIQCENPLNFSRALLYIFSQFLWHLRCSVQSSGLYTFGSGSSHR
jgi:hypothetical protein